MRISGPAGFKYVIPEADGGTIVEHGATNVPSQITLIGTAGAGWGPWTQINASLSADSWVCSFVVAAQVNDYELVVELGTGAGGSETTFSRVSLPAALTQPVTVHTIAIPIKIASGTRLAGRCGSGGATNNIIVSVQYYQGL